MSVVAGPGNTAIVTLSAPIQASDFTLDINASGIDFGGVSGTDTDYSFLALPGDVDTGFAVNGDDPLDAVPRQGSLIFATQPDGSNSFGDYSFRADLNGDNIINGDDILAAVGLTSSIVID